MIELPSRIEFRYIRIVEHYFGNLSGSWLTTCHALDTNCYHAQIVLKENIKYRTPRKNFKTVCPCTFNYHIASTLAYLTILLRYGFGTNFYMPSNLSRT